MNRLIHDDHQLSVIDLRVLDILHKSVDGSARMGDLAEALAASRRQMTKRIDRLGERDLVRRAPDPQDRRGVVAILTDDGRSIVEQARISYGRGVARYLLGPLSTRQVETVAENCWRISQGPSAPGAPGEQVFPEAPACYLPGIDDAGKRCWHQFLESSQVLFPAINDRLVAAQQLTLTEVVLVDRIAKSPGGSAPLSVVGEAFALQPSRVTQLVTRLETRNLVRRGPDPGDRRRVVATVTAHGRARLSPALVVYAREIRRSYLDPMTHQQAIALGDACRRISVALKTGTDRFAGMR